MSKDQNPSDKACDAYFDNPYAATSGSYYSDRVTFYAGFAAGAASRDAEVAELKTVPMKYRRMAFNAQLQAEVAELAKERDQLRTELVKALAACKAKDEALESCGFDDDSTDSEMCGSYHDIELVQRALDIQPDDAALKASMQSKGVSYE